MDPILALMTKHPQLTGRQASILLKYPEMEQQLLAAAQAAAAGLNPFAPRQVINDDGDHTIIRGTAGNGNANTDIQGVRVSPFGSIISATSSNLSNNIVGDSYQHNNRQQQQQNDVSGPFSVRTSAPAIIQRQGSATLIQDSTGQQYLVQPVRLSQKQSQVLSSTSFPAPQNQDFPAPSSSLPLRYASPVSRDNAAARLARGAQAHHQHHHTAPPPSPPSPPHQQHLHGQRSSTSTELTDLVESVRRSFQGVNPFLLEKTSPSPRGGLGEELSQVVSWHSLDLQHQDINNVRAAHRPPSSPAGQKMYNSGDSSSNETYYYSKQPTGCGSVSSITAAAAAQKAATGPGSGGSSGGSGCGNSIPRGLPLGMARDHWHLAGGVPGPTRMSDPGWLESDIMKYRAAALMRNDIVTPADFVGYSNNISTTSGNIIGGGGGTMAPIIVDGDLKSQISGHNNNSSSSNCSSRANLNDNKNNISNNNNINSAASTREIEAKRSASGPLPNTITNERGSNDLVLIGGYDQRRKQLGGGREGFLETHPTTPAHAGGGGGVGATTGTGTGTTTTNASVSNPGSSPQNSISDDYYLDWEIQPEEIQLGPRIGIGSFGEVYRGQWRQTDVAVKRLLDQDISPTVLEQFRDEVSIMKRLRHPNIVAFMGAVTLPPNLCIVTQFIARGSLFKLLHRTPNFKPEEWRRMQMALDVARGMNYLHSGRPPIIHHDLKSPNLLVDKDFTVKVCDFGLSKVQRSTWLTGRSRAGTPEWTAPEILRSEPSNVKSDVYSFGVILYELVSGEEPWMDKTPMQVVGCVGWGNERLPIPENGHPEIRELMRRCFGDQAQRPTFSEIIVILKRVLKDMMPNHHHHHNNNNNGQHK